MASTTITTEPTSLSGSRPTLRSMLRLAVFALIAAALLVGTFVVARVSAPTHTVRTFITVPATVPAPPAVCRIQSSPC